MLKLPLALRAEVVALELKPETIPPLLKNSERSTMHNRGPLAGKVQRLPMPRQMIAVATGGTVMQTARRGAVPRQQAPAMER